MSTKGCMKKYSVPIDKNITDIQAKGKNNFDFSTIVFLFFLFKIPPNIAIPINTKANREV
jgi:hypothetical protein